jgi:L-ascorbate metabolism protein UlaG (beta-lactamase superfamily)
MSAKEAYLRPNVLVEPLINRWYAWSYLISPAAAAMFIANSHIKIMQSFITASQTHINALKNPDMAGGPFINYGANRVPEIKALREKTIKEQSHMLEFAKAVQAVDEMLSNEAAGYSCEPLYAKVPDVLRGYVELVYDLNNHASLRFIEGLLYKSPYNNSSSQNIGLSLINSDNRHFVFSTPRLDDAGRVILNTPFNNEGLDLLFDAKLTPKAIEYLKDALGVQPQDAEQFSTFFTDEEPAPPANYTGDDVRVRYFGHACILIELKNLSILCDPLISYEYDSKNERYTYADLPESIDYVLITHNHQDHCILETLIQLRHRIKNVIVPKNGGGTLADPSLRLVLKSLGFRDVCEIDEMESVEVIGGSITSLPFFGEHADLNIRTKTAYLVNLNGRSILCAADSNNIEPKLYEKISALIGEIDVIFLGMECVGGPLTWLYGPLLTKPLTRKMDQSRRFDGSNSEKAIKIVNQLKPKQVYVYAMGQEPWLTFLTSLRYTEESPQIIESNKLIEECRSRDIIAERLFCRKELFL